MLPPGLLVIHDPTGRCEDDEPELSAGQQIVGPLFDVVDGNIKTRRDNTTLVESSRQIDHNLPGSVIVNHLELSDVAVLHHDGQEPHDDLNERGVTRLIEIMKPETDLGAGSDEDLSLAPLLSIVDAFEGISQRVHTNHPDLFLTSLKGDPSISHNDYILTYPAFLQEINNTQSLVSLNFITKISVFEEILEFQLDCSVLLSSISTCGARHSQGLGLSSRNSAGQFCANLTQRDLLTTSLPARLRTLN